MVAGKPATVDAMKAMMAAPAIFMMDFMVVVVE